MLMTGTYNAALPRPLLAYSVEELVIEAAIIDPILST